MLIKNAFSIKEKHILIKLNTATNYCYSCPKCNEYFICM